MLHLVKPLEGDGLDILLSATAVPIDDEQLRLAAVLRYEILDTAPEAACDRITALAADLFNVPISIIGFVDRDRIWFKSHHGLDATEIERGAAGSTTVLPSIAFTLPSGVKTDVWSTDIRSTELRSNELRSIATPHVVGAAGRRFCIAVPLRTTDGFDLGTLCVMDSQPIAVDARRIRQLETLAAIVMDQLEVRLASRRAEAQAVIMAGENDHRTMNSLQFVASLLNLQSRAVRTTEAAGQLTAAANRVSAVARVHRTFAAEPTARAAADPCLSSPPVRRARRHPGDRRRDRGHRSQHPDRADPGAGTDRQRARHQCQEARRGGDQGHLPDRAAGASTSFAFSTRARACPRASRPTGTRPAASA